MAVTEKVKQLRESCGFLADEDLYEFAEIMFNKIRSDFNQAGLALSKPQQDIVSVYFRTRDMSSVVK